MFEPRTYFTENDENSVEGFTIIDRDEDSGEYHIAENWDGKWLQYWIPASQLQSRIEKNKCAKKGSLNDDQYETVCENISHSGVTPTATA